VGDARGQPGVVAVLTAAVVLAVPFGQVGASVDFAMRASIPALALLAIMMARGDRCRTLA
jgi:hypothetical protein